MVDDLSAWLAGQFPSVTDWQTLNDSEAKCYRAAGYEKGRLVVVFNAEQGHSLPAESRWAESLLGLELDDNQRYAILAGNEGSGAMDEGAIICSCFQIGENTIKQAIAGGCVSAEALGKQLKCGTNCGSCIPELNTLIQSVDITEVSE